MNRIQWKDFLREIRKNKGRFLSLLFIVALGCAFYSGIRSSEPDMTMSADRYYDETNFCDIRIVSTLGLTDEDVKAVSEIPGVMDCEGGKSVELFAEGSDDQPILNIVSLGEKINQFTVKEGRLPVKEDECFMDVRYMNMEQAKIGDTVTLLNTDKEAPEELTRQEFTIVGYGTWAWYLNLTRGTASIGDGSVDAFMVLKPEAFTQEYYMNIFATVEGAKEVNTYDDAYDEIIEAITDRLENLAEVQVPSRRNALVAEGQDAIDEGKEKIADAKKELADAEQKLNDGEKEYADGLKEYEEGKQELADGKKDYEKGLADWKKGKKEYEDGLKSYQEGLAEYEDGLKQYEDGKKALQDGKNALESGKRQLSDGRAAYEAGVRQWEEGKKTLEEKQAQADAAQVQLTEAQNTLDTQKASLTEQKQTVQATINTLTEKKTELTGQKEELEKNLALAQAAGMDTTELEAGLGAVAAGLSQVEEGLTQAQGGLSQLEAGLLQVTAGEAQLAEQKKALEAGMLELAKGWEEVNAGKEVLDRSGRDLSAASDKIASGEREIAQNEQKLLDAEKELADAKQELLDGEQELNDAKKKLDDGEKELADAGKEIEDGEKELLDAEQELADARKELDDGWKEYREGKAEADEKIKEAEADIADGEQQLADIPEGKWYVLTRDEIQTCVEYGMDAERIGKIASVFPMIFFLVAALVSLTTMTRMIEEERMLIGTMKAMGYGKFAIVSKYLVYAATATLAGGIGGILIGGKILPYVIMTAYGMLYTNVPYILMPYHFTYSATAIGMALFCTVGATLSACYRELLSTPAQLMRPPAPKSGKKILLERISWLWNHLNFNMKSTLRNLFRYKKRFFMTVVGIGGCMAVLLVSYGLHDSIAAIVDNQYKKVWTYSASCNLEENLTAQEKLSISRELASDEEVAGSMLARNISLDVTNQVITKNAYLYVVENEEAMEGFLDLHDRETKEKYSLTDEGVVLSEKLARTLEVKSGDTVTLKISDSEYKTVKVTAAAENYLFNYVYMTAALYESVFNEAPEYNECVLRYQNPLKEAEEDLLAERLLSKEGVISVSLVRNLQDSVNDMMNALNLVVWVLVIAAGLLVFVVSFNLNNINISERRREMASLKVLGFYDMEVAMYVYRENLFLTFFGIFAGLFMGTALHRFVITTLEVEMIMFGRKISVGSYVYSSLLTLFFSIIVNIMMYYKLKQIDMVESLKSVE